MFVGYMISEFKCMDMFFLRTSKKVEREYLSITGTERCARQTTVGTMCCCFTMFLVFQGLLLSVPACCYDTWLDKGTWFNRTSPAGHIVPEVLMVAHVNNTATGVSLAFKFGSYLSECCAGVMLIMSHFTVWYFSEERHVPYGDSHLEVVFNDDDDEEEYSDDLSE